MAMTAIIIGRSREVLELRYPRLRPAETGHGVVITGPRAGKTYLGT